MEAGSKGIYAILELLGNSSPDAATSDSLNSDNLHDVFTASRHCEWKTAMNMYVRIYFKSQIYAPLEPDPCDRRMSPDALVPPAH